MHSRVHSFRTPDGVTLGVEHFGDAAAPLVLLAGGTTMLDAAALARGLDHQPGHLAGIGVGGMVAQVARSTTRTPSRHSHWPGRGPSHRAGSTTTCPTTTGRR